MSRDAIKLFGATPSHFMFYTFISQGNKSLVFQLNNSAFGHTGNLYLYADDTTVYCIGLTVDEACNLLNNALDELNKWCTANSLTPHSSKCEVMLLHRGSFIGPHPLITIGNVNVAWVCHARLLGITIDRKLTWKKHLTELKVNFVSKLNLLKKCSFLKRKSLLDLYFKVILPSVTYGITI